MTRKLYYEDVNQLEFESKVTGRGKDEGGYYIVLESTAFYPTGGGQPYDEGTVNGLKVVDVEEVDGEVRHYIEETFPEETEVVTGIVDRERRIDHMQQHNGQHILSAVFDDQYGIPTTSFHLGRDTVTIDLGTPTLTDELLQEAEQKVNEIVRANLPVETKWVYVEEAATYPLRKPLAVEGEARLVIIPGVDYNGCGGTHPIATGEVMAVKLMGWTKNKKQVRLEFVCGYRVLEKLGQKHDVLTELKQFIPRPEEKMAAEVDEMIQASKEKEKKIAELEEQLLTYEADEIVAEANGAGVIQRVFQDRPIKGLQSLGKAITEKSPFSYIILISEQPDQLQFVLARGSEIDRNMNEIAKQSMPLIEGKGGGKPDFVQGGGKRLMDGEVFAEEIRGLL
ncbi:alanyl-tRNA editing protein [Halobacillus fulvus]|nr:alanyl-tRNA editing protein [Halobacillus fulvus]